ncbi:MAG TPA: BatA domain-containing protein [Tepidisphaeraceae bacterium]|jgi:hypothetical protein|nr:BatA domain-containing protein [Tepidisphaeraceae bacterium]
MIQFVLAFGFLTWGFFWAGLGLISIPIIIHLLNRRRFRTVTWAAMEFLLRAMRKNRRRLKFEQWLLLATRCLLLFLLGLALARPLGCENSALAQFGRHTALNVFVVDNSYSTAYEANNPDARTHLDQAKKLVRSILNRPTSGGESVVVITAGKPAAALISKPQFDMEEARQSVGRIEQSYGSTDLAGALQMALKIARDESAQPNKNLYIVTDSTRSAWEGRESQALGQIGPQLAGEFKEIKHFNLSAGKPQWNGAVVDLKPADNLVTTKFKTEFKADVRGFGPSHDGTLQWKLDDQSLDKATGGVKLDGATPPQTLSEIGFVTGGAHLLTAQLIDDDRLSIDNVRYRVVDVASELKVLIVEGKRGIGPLEGSGAFLATALAPLKEAEPGKPQHSDSYVSPEVITDLELSNKVLGDYSAVILAGVGQLTPGEADAMQKFVEQGGTLMLFMGDAVNKENYNSLLLPRKLLPGPLVKLMSVGTNEKAYNFDFKAKSVLHPFLSIFANQENTGLDTARIFSYWQADVPAASGVERVLNYLPVNPKNPADPAVTVQTTGLGRVVFFSTTANEDWTSFAAKPAYVPLMHELLSGAVRTGDWWMNLSVGQSLEIPPTVRLSVAPTLADANGAPIVIDPETRDGRVIYRTQPINKPGVYMLSLGDRKIPIAVNVPAADEANVTTLTDDAVRHALGDIAMTMQSAEAPEEAIVGREGNDFSWWTMAAVLALVGFECFIAMKLGHYRQASRDPSTMTGSPPTRGAPKRLAPEPAGAL